MINIEKIKKNIIQKLTPLGLNKVILFGSYAYGNPTDDSDIDLYVVTNDDFIPENYKEKQNIVRRVSNSILELRENFCIDLIVHTKKMNQEFSKINSLLADDINNRGISLI